MSIRNCCFGSRTRYALVSASLFAATALVASAQTAPQLLPYTSKLIAGGGATATFTVGAACPVAGLPYTAADKYGDGCLATEVQLATTYGGPRAATVDANGNIFFADYSAGLVRRVDAVTGIISAVAGGATTTPGNGVACGTAATPKSTDILGDGCLGTQVKLGRPGGVAFDASGNLYFSDTYNYNVRKITATTGYLFYTTITNGGTGYTTAPTVTFSAPTTGTTATGTAIVSSGGIVLGIQITNAGSGYTSAPTVTFSAPTTGTTATASTVIATGIPPAGGTVTLIDGDAGGTSSHYGYQSNNGSLTSCTQTGAVCQNAATQGYLDGPAGLAFDPNNNLYIADYYNNAVLVVNTGTATDTVTGVSIPAGTVSKIVGAPNSANSLAANGVSGFTVCPNGSSCGYNPFVPGSQANASETDYPFGVTYDLAGNVYYASIQYNDIAIVSPTGVLNNYAGQLNSTTTLVGNTVRGLAGTFAIGASYSVTADNYNPGANVYFPDASNGLIWRVDGSGQNMYAVGGGASAATLCSAKTDAFGDGCPALQATFGASGVKGSSSATASAGVYGAYVDNYADLIVADSKNYLIREIASGTQFGVVGANLPVQTIELHFASGDSVASAAYALTTNPSNFTLGTLTCAAAYSDGTTDCTLPITATPTVLGPFNSNLKVTSKNGSSNFLLTGIFEPSPKTRTALTVTSATCPGSTTVSSTLPLTLKAVLTAAGPSTPGGSFNFYANGSSTPLNATPIATSNIGTASAPVYGAVLSYTFSTPATYAITAVYSGDSYYLTSTSTSSSITSSAPGYTLTPVSNMQSSIVAGQTALYSFNVGLNVYAGTISFAVTGLPAYATYALSPTTVTSTGCTSSTAAPYTVALSIFTQQKTVQVGSFGGTGHGPWQLLSVVVGLGLALFLGLRRRRVPMPYGQLWMLLALLIASSGALACGKAAGTVLTPPTPSGSYTITVTPTGTTGTAPAPITFPLTVN